MAESKITARAGNSTVQIDNSQVVRLANRITDGAVETFMAAAHKQLDPVVASAKTELWPRKTGRSQAATYIEDRIAPTFAEVVALNPVPYTFKLRFSVVTAATIDRESAQQGARIWGRLEPYVDRVNPTDRTLRGPHAGKGGARRRAASHFAPMATDGRWSGWWLRADPSQQAVRNAYKADMIDRHGTGAPTEQLAGKHVWNTRVRNPARKREAALIDDARAALDTLARG